MLSAMICWAWTPKQDCSWSPDLLRSVALEKLAVSEVGLYGIIFLLSSVPKLWLSQLLKSQRMFQTEGGNPTPKPSLFPFQLSNHCLGYPIFLDWFLSSYSDNFIYLMVSLCLWPYFCFAVLLFIPSTQLFIWAENWFWNTITTLALSGTLSSEQTLQLGRDWNHSHL